VAPIGQPIIKIMAKDIILTYGCARPPKKVVKYLGSKNLYYNEDHIQNYKSPPFCGHLCLIVLKKLTEGYYYDTVLKTCKADIFKLKNKFAYKINEV
jgi:hypothetical protein